MRHPNPAPPEDLSHLSPAQMEQYASNFISRRSRGTGRSAEYKVLTARQLRDRQEREIYNNGNSLNFAELARKHHGPLERN